MNPLTLLATVATPFILNKPPGNRAGKLVRAIKSLLDQDLEASPIDAARFCIGPIELDEVLLVTDEELFAEVIAKAWPGAFANLDEADRYAIALSYDGERALESAEEPKSMRRWRRRPRRHVLELEAATKVRGAG